MRQAACVHGLLLLLMLPVAAASRQSDRRIYLYDRTYHAPPVSPAPAGAPSRASLERHSNIIPLSTHADGRTAKHLCVTCGAPLRREHAMRCLSAGSQCRPSARARTSAVVSVYRRRTCKPGATEIVMGIVIIDKTKLKQGRLKLFGIRAHLQDE